MKKQNCLKSHVALASASLLGAQLVTAGNPGSVFDDVDPMVTDFNMCDIFDKNTLYQSDSGFIRKIKLQGRYHSQYISAG